MTMFSVTDQVAKLNVTVRTDKDGTERIPAMALTISYATSNDDLAMFGPDLKSSLYRRADLETADMADRADPRNDDPNYMPKLRNPEVKSAMELTHELVGAEVTVQYGTGGKSNIVLEECKVGSFKIVPQEGGTVHLSYEIYCHPTSAQAGKLYELHCREVTITVEPPSDPQMPLGSD